jgi:hypothetical protein
MPVISHRAGSAHWLAGLAVGIALASCGDSPSTDPPWRRQLRTASSSKRRSCDLGHVS